MYNFLQLIFTGLALLVAIIALYTAKRIMVNQIFSGLVADYRSPEMGMAVLALFHFFVIECNGDVSVIDKKYREKYEEQIGKHLGSDTPPNFSQTLHFQRRLVAQFYYNLATLRYKRCIFRLSKKDLKVMFTPEENKLLSIVLHLAEPASNVFIRAEIPKPPKTEVYMNKLIHKLYEDTKHSALFKTKRQVLS